MPRPDRNIRVDAVVLRHSDWGETDRLLVLYSKEQGKLRASGFTADVVGDESLEDVFLDMIEKAPQREGAS